MSQSAILYNCLDNDDILNSIKLKTRNLRYGITNLARIAYKYNLEGNIWRCYIAFLLLSCENVYTLSCEKQYLSPCTIKDLAYMDIKKFYSLFFYDFSVILEEEPCFKYVLDFEKENQEKKSNLTYIGKTVQRFANALSKSKNDLEFMKIVEDYYRDCGVGKYGLNKAFYISNDEELIPVSSFKDVSLEDLWGYELQKKQLVDNTKAFLNGKSANNVLLYGDSGTGKSTMIKALLNDYHSQGLRIIEIHKHQFKLLKSIINILKDRNYYFIIYMDDLSFEDFEIEYKYLKAIIEGGIENIAKNVLIYATSNRRHLIKESFSDRNDMDNELHRSDTMQEKLSLADRFGVAINFSKPVQKEYNEIVKYLAKRKGLHISEEELIAKARVWGLNHGGLSGRVAQQCIDSIEF